MKSKYGIKKGTDEIEIKFQLMRKSTNYPETYIQNNGNYRTKTILTK